MLIKAFAQEKNIQLNVCFTGQHKEMVLPLLDFFEIKVNSSLDVMQPSQTLAGLSSLSISKVNEYLYEIQPDIIFVQGDTTTAMCSAIAAFYKKIKIAHVEAGLRTYNMLSPFPEEFNRQVISKITDLHFAPTILAKENLLKENINESKIFVTGNTVIDALLFTKEKLKNNPSLINSNYQWDINKKNVLITGHRRENFGDGFENICNAIRHLAQKYHDHNFIYPVHLNPNVQEPVKRILSNAKNIYLVPPMNYVAFTALMDKSYLILSDSGGVQEEAPTLGKPVLVMRDTTERPEAIIAGTAKLIGITEESIIKNVSDLLDDEEKYKQMALAKNPFGNGTAAKQIVKQTLAYFN